MGVKKEKHFPRAKSYTSIYDLLGSSPFSNFIFKNSKNVHRNASIFQATCGDSPKAKPDSINSILLNACQYVTSEQYHLLNKESSCKSIVRSNSTIFYDLDDVAKRHSFHCMHDGNESNVNILKVMKIPLITSGFLGKSEAIVQECATQIQPKILLRDSIEINSKKIKNSYRSPDLSSEIFLRDNEYDTERKKSHYEKEQTNRPQKFWSYAKYRTEYTNPIPDEKKHRKKDRGKRTEDPCPCQLFSYACPCSDKKSLTELAKNSKSQTLADQITSTTRIQPDDRNNRAKKSKHNTTREDKLLNTDYNKDIEKYDIATKNEGVITGMTKEDIPKLAEDSPKKIASKCKSRSSKKQRKIKCPKCMENVEILLSTTDEEDSLKYVNSSAYRFKEVFSKTSPSRTRNNRRRSLVSQDNCVHEPRCELVPVCQILPTDNVYLNHKCIRNPSSQKSPKVIRITKACRHHPPCTVVPSCQRLNVLKNNCEYIPPCLHRPRCVNLPLCVPVSKTFHFDDTGKNLEETETMECHHIPKCKYYPECQYETLGNHLEHHPNIMSQVQNACEFLNECQQPFAINQKMTYIPKLSPSPIPNPTPCNCCKSNKSCQFDCPDCKCNKNKETPSSEAVIFIRDVGCQFRNKRCSPKSSDEARMSNGSIDYVDVKMGNHYQYQQVHTMRCEDKFTTPMVEEDISETSTSLTSLEIDAQCPTHGEKALRKQSERQSGFIPKVNISPHVAYTTRGIFSQLFMRRNSDLCDPSLVQGYGTSALAVNSRKNFQKGKNRKTFSAKRRRKPRASSHIQSVNSTKKLSNVDMF